MSETSKPHNLPRGGRDKDSSPRGEHQSAPSNQHSELRAAIQVLQESYDHGHPDDLAKCPGAFETLDGFVEQLEVYEKALTKLAGWNNWRGEDVQDIARETLASNPAKRPES